MEKTPYKLWHGKPPKISYLRVFGYKCFILNIKDHLHKFDAKAEEGIFLGYSTRSNTYRVYNKRTKVVEESMHVTFDESNPMKKKKVDDIEYGINEVTLEDGKAKEIVVEGHASPSQKVNEQNGDEDQEEDEPEELPRSWRFVKHHPQNQILGNLLKE